MYEVRGKLFIDSTERRTFIVMGTFDTLAEATSWLADEYADDTPRVLNPGEELTIEKITE